jgi:hypothetical protein
MFKGIDKKRPTRAPHEIYALEGMKKRHPHTHDIAEDTSMTLRKGQQ